MTEFSNLIPHSYSGALSFMWAKHGTDIKRISDERGAMEVDGDISEKAIHEALCAYEQENSSKNKEDLLLQITNIWNKFKDDPMCRRLQNGGRPAASEIDALKGWIVGVHGKEIIAYNKQDEQDIEKYNPQSTELSQAQKKKIQGEMEKLLQAYLGEYNAYDAKERHEMTSRISTGNAFKYFSHHTQRAYANFVLPDRERIAWKASVLLKKGVPHNPAFKDDVQKILEKNYTEKFENQR